MWKKYALGALAVMAVIAVYNVLKTRVAALSFLP